MSISIPLRGDFNASQLRGLAKRTKDGRQARRLLALAAIYDGATRSEAAKLGDVGLQIIRDWGAPVQCALPPGPVAPASSSRQQGPRLLMSVQGQLQARSSLPAAIPTAGVPRNRTRIGAIPGWTLCARFGHSQRRSGRCR
jgi:hypothetical protein